MKIKKQLFFDNEKLEYEHFKELYRQCEIPNIKNFFLELNKNG